ncbi:hypothetical protein B0I35DRAFT_434360 [Stachybotrys elegans]|uniref:Uncharacterized protein n=1 Tax=Stachybotrys elegans TaxID=80388 RepID=A0A8K0WQ02_9HYPO|nr:hypothetical protein B0I35DRAFT_434360 [Stachybotrys elegans]
MAEAPIDPVDIHDYAAAHKVLNPRGPRRCFCGRYLFYSSICGHLYQDYPLKCGSTTSKSGKTGFCSIPAPQHHMEGRVNLACAQCRV